MIAGAPKGSERSVAGRMLTNRIFLTICLCVTSLSIIALATLIITILFKGLPFLDLQFLTSSPSRNPEECGIWAALWGTSWLLVVCAAAALPLGVGTAVFMEEFQPKGRITRLLYGFVQLNVRNLAGVPSIVYGIIGLTVFSTMFGVFGEPHEFSDYSRVVRDDGPTIVGEIFDATEETVTIQTITGMVTIDTPSESDIDLVHVRDFTVTLKDGRNATGRIEYFEPVWGDGDQPEGLDIVFRPRDGEDFTFSTEDVADFSYTSQLTFGDEDWPFYIRFPFGSSVMTGGLTLMLVILPIVVISSQEALRAVPSSLREGALAIGCSKWQTISRMVLPNAVPGIMTGSILAMSRAIGEAAPLLVIGGAAFVSFTPNNLMSDFAAMPLQIYNWTGRPQDEFRMVAASGIIVLLAMLLVFNSTAVLIRQRYHQTN